ncbi:MAG: hypothetical protein WCP12_16090 [bacterium]
MKALAEFFTWIWKAVTTTFPKVATTVAAIGTAFTAVCTYFSTLVQGVSTIASTMTEFSSSVSSAVAPVRDSLVGNEWFQLAGYAINLDTLLGTLSLIITGVISIVGIMVGLSVGFLVLYSGFVVLSYVLRLLKGLTASFIDFN